MPQLRILLSAAAGLLVLAGATCGATDVLRLSDLPDWQLDNNAGFGNVSLSSVHLPAAVLQLLQQAGVVGDPLYRYNELEQRWVAYDNWTFSVKFQAPPALLHHRTVILRCDGLDTVAAIELNGGPVALTANAHRPHTFDVTQLLSSGGNRLSITLFSAPLYAAMQQAAYPYAVPATQQVGAIPGYNFIRKAASDFGWDWGPAFAPAGINGAMELLGQSSAVLTGVAVRQQHLANGSVLLQADALLLPPPPPREQQQQAGVQGTAQAGAAEQGTVELVLRSPDGLQHWRAKVGISVPLAAPSAGGTCPGDGSGSRGSSSGSCPWLLPEACQGKQAAGLAHVAPQTVRRSIGLLVEAPELWWPHDFGRQPLYHLQLTYTPSLGSNASAAGAGPGSGTPAAKAQQEGSGAPATEAPAAQHGAELGRQSSMLARRIGLRTVELVTDLLPGGESFYFQVNGQPLYARGANVVPAHILEPAVTAAHLRQLVADAKAVHMNMLRVWGGGRYFQDAFYEACDEEGVLVWQEAMFACAMYPQDDAFLREAWLEVSHQVVRLSSHPSVAIWGANNENEAAFRWFDAPTLNPRLYAADFSKLFVDVVQQAVLGTDPTTPFVDTSPSNGLLSREPYAKRWGDVADPRFGDVHFYDYRSDAWAAATYPPAKFVSEYGFMSLPSFAAYKQVTDPTDWRLGAPMTAFRMRHANGLKELLAQMARHFLHSPQQQQRAVQQQQAPTEQQQVQEVWELQGAEERLERLAAAQSALVAAFDKAEAARDDPAAAVHTAVAGGKVSVAVTDSVPAESTSPPAPEAGQGAGAEQQQRQFEALTYLSQLQQAIAYQAAIHQWRRNKADPGALTMGVLFWQLNDVWQGPSWSAINADGSWRLAQHFAAEAFRPVLVSGVIDGAGVEVHLTNDLPVEVTGSLAVDIIPYAATSNEQVVPLYHSDNASIPASDGRLAWRGSITADVLPAAGLLPKQPCTSDCAVAASDGGGGSSASGSRPAEAADVLLRLRFCPTAVRRQLAPAGAAVVPPNPFGSASAVEELQRALSGGATSCDAPVMLQPGANEAQCDAAHRLLQCSESLVLLTEPKDARLAAANISMQLTAGTTDGSQQEGGSPGAEGSRSSCSPALAVTLASDAVALYVSVENERQAGRFNGSGTLLLLPWKARTLVFQPAATFPGRTAPPCSVHQQQQQAGVPGAEDGGTADGSTGAAAGHPAAEGEEAGATDEEAPGISLYWLQKEMASLQSLTAAGEVSNATLALGLHAPALLLALAFAACVLLL